VPDEGVGFIEFGRAWRGRGKPVERIGDAGEKMKQRGIECHGPKRVSRREEGDTVA